MKHDAIYGPPEEIFAKVEHKEETNEKKKKPQQKLIFNRFDIKEDHSKAFDKMKLREYELAKMKYYYAIVYCDSEQTASKLYEEMNDFEFEFSNLKLDLRMVPPETKFPHKPKEVVFEIPKNYETKFGSMGAKNHTNVNLTWEQADPKRYKFLTKRLSKEKVEEIDYKDYMASSNSSDEQSEDEEEIMRKRALLGLDKESENESSDEDVN